MDSIQKINRIWKGIIALDEKDFNAVESMANEQIAFMHPLKMAKQSKLNKTGEYNLKVLNALKSLHQIIINGNP